MKRESNPVSQWRVVAASCVIGILVGLGTANVAIIGQVSESRTLLIGLRRDLDSQREDFKVEQRRMDDRINRQQDTFRESLTLLREQNLLMKQMLESKNKP